MQFVAAYLLAGGILAVTVFALSALAIPMLLDRKADIVTAMMTSFRATEKNIGAIFMLSKPGLVAHAAVPGR